MHQVCKFMGSSKRQDWPTPDEWFHALDLEFDFTLDPCCTHETAKCKKHFTPEEDGLAQSWADERVFCNPPYGGAQKHWLRKAYLEARDNRALVVAFVPARVDTDWWHRWANLATECRFPKGRVKNADGSSWPFPVAVLVYRPGLGSANTKADGSAVADTVRRVVGD